MVRLFLPRSGVPTLFWGTPELSFSSKGRFMQMMRVRVKATRQVLDMVPDVARRMIAGGTAEEVSATEGSRAPIESMTHGQAQTAVAPQQAGPRRKARR
jgi:hypothetical protein